MTTSAHITPMDTWEPPGMPRYPEPPTPTGPPDPVHGNPDPGDPPDANIPPIAIVANSFNVGSISGDLHVYALSTPLYYPTDFVNADANGVGGHAHVQGISGPVEMSDGTTADLFFAVTETGGECIAVSTLYVKLSEDINITDLGQLTNDIAQMVVGNEGWVGVSTEIASSQSSDYLSEIQITAAQAIKNDFAGGGTTSLARSTVIPAALQSNGRTETLPVSTSAGSYYSPSHQQTSSGQTIPATIKIDS